MSCEKCKENLPIKKEYELVVRFNEDFTDKFKILSLLSIHKKVYCYQCYAFLYEEQLRYFKRLKFLKEILTHILKSTI